MRKAEDGNPEATLGGRMDFWLLALAMAVKVDRVYFMYGCGPAKQRSETFALETFDSLETWFTWDFEHQHQYQQSASTKSC